MNTICECRVHLRNDEEDRKLGKEPLPCSSHGPGCPCYKETVADKEAKTIENMNNKREYKFDF